MYSVHHLSHSPRSGNKLYTRFYGLTSSCLFSSCSFSSFYLYSCFSCPCVNSLLWLVISVLNSKTPEQKLHPSNLFPRKIPDRFAKGWIFYKFGLIQHPKSDPAYLT